MPRKPPIREWIEAYDGCLSDEPGPGRPGRYEVYLFINRVRAVERGGRRVVERTPDVVKFDAPTQDLVDLQVCAYFETPGVRALATTVRLNEPGDVPKRERLTDELLDGTAAIYQQPEAAHA